MEVFLDCLPCMLRQVLEASRMATAESELQERIMEESIKILSDYKKYRCSPEMARDVHRNVKKIVGVSDPYEKIKEKDIKAAKRVLPLLESFLKQKQNTLYWALKIAATGNIIDAAIYNNLDIEACIKEEIEKEFSICDIEIFENKLKKAKSLLIIGDNAGETVFDNVLVKHLSHLDIFYAVRNEPIINDATVKEAFDSGLGEYARILSAGCNTPGAVLEECSEEFIKILDNADIVITKGQGNFEALSDCGKKIFFLLKAKCPMVSKKFNANLNDYVFKYY